jgi:hypothetical protein
MRRTDRTGTVHILYIAGWGRSGSTILDNVLGQVDGFFSTGEIRSIWDRGLIENWPCSCGAAFRDCDLWRSVFVEAFGGFERVDARRMTAIRDRFDRPWKVFLPRGLASAAIAEYRSALTRLYAAVASVSGAKIIVDSSKTPAYCRILQDLSGFRVDIVHLLRDPRAVAFSWQRKRRWVHGEEAYMSRFGPTKSSLMWDGRQIATEAVGRRAPVRYLRLRYEDFVAAPEQGLARVLGLTGIGTVPRFAEGRKLALQPIHGISGNPSRFARGTVELKADDEWLVGMKPADRWIVTMLTAPLLMRYRYPVAAGASA